MDWRTQQYRKAMETMHLLVDLSMFMSHVLLHRHSQSILKMFPLHGENTLPITLSSNTFLQKVHLGIVQSTSTMGLLSLPSIR